MESIVMIPTNRIRRGKRLFRQLKEAEMANLVESVGTNGILTPLVVERSSDGFYDLLSGYNRLDAAEKLQILELPCLVAPARKRYAAMFDTDLVRRQMTREEQLEMAGVKSSYEARKEAVGALIDELKDLDKYLPIGTLMYLRDIPVDEQRRIYAAIPRQVVEDTRRVSELEERLDQYESVMGDLKREKKKAQEQLAGLKEVKEQYETLKKVKQEELENLARKQAAELEKEYQESDEAVRMAVEKERVRLTEELKAEVEDARQHAREMSLLVDKKNTEIASLNVNLEHMRKERKETEEEEKKAAKMSKFYEKIVASIAQPDTVAERVKIVLKELDQVRNTIHAVGTGVFLKQREVKESIIKATGQMKALIDEIGKLMETNLGSKVEPAD